MPRISELLFPLLAEFGLSEEYNRRRAQHRVERQQDEAGTDDGHQDIRADVGTHSNHAGIDRHEKRALGEGERAGHLLAPEASSNQHHAKGKENDAEGQEVHGLGRLEIESAADNRPVVQRVQLFNWDARRKRNEGALAVRHAALGKPVLDVLPADISTDRSSQSAGAAVVKVEGSLDARFLAHGVPRVAK